jgi:hypothetical protein
MKSAENRVRNQGVAYKLHHKNNKTMKSADKQTGDQGVAYRRITERRGTVTGNREHGYKKQQHNILF